MAISNSLAEYTLRNCLEKEGYKLSPKRGHGELGVDIVATKDDEDFHIEVIGFKDKGPTRAKDFYEVFFRAISRLKDGAQYCVIALPDRFKRGLPQRARQYGIAWRRVGEAFPELEIWLIKCDEQISYKRTTWAEWLK